MVGFCLTASNMNLIRFYRHAITVILLRYKMNDYYITNVMNPVQKCFNGAVYIDYFYRRQVSITLNRFRIFILTSNASYNMFPNNRK